MSEVIKIYEVGSEGRDRLERLARMMSRISNEVFYVKEVYFDFGQNWMWSTVCALNNGYQALNPRHMADLMSIEDSDMEILRLAKSILDGKFSPVKADIDRYNDVARRLEGVA